MIERGLLLNKDQQFPWCLRILCLGGTGKTQKDCGKGIGEQGADTLEQWLAN